MLREFRFPLWVRTCTIEQHHDTITDTDTDTDTDDRASSPDQTSVESIEEPEQSAHPRLSKVPSTARRGQCVEQAAR
jgi:hypothetical protein